MSLLRLKLRATRRALSDTERADKSLTIFKLLSTFPPFIKATSIAAYWPTAEEVTTESLIQNSQKLGKKIYLPVIKSSNIKTGDMYFRHYEPNVTMLERNRFGIYEPFESHKTEQISGSFDLMIVPVVGFNKNCDRIGMGGGFYDRYLSHVERQRSHFVGLAFSCQQQHFDPKPHDVKLDAIITEAGIIQRE